MPKDDLILREIKGSPLTFVEVDGNFKRLMYASGAWSAGTYEKEEIVQHEGGTWRCVAETTTAEPGTDILAWQPIAPILGRGNVNLLTPVSGITIGTGWTKVPFDNLFAGQNPYGMTIDIVNDQFTFAFQGMWAFGILVSMHHAESNQGRDVTARLWNVTKSAVGGSFVYPIARNQPGSMISAPVPVYVDSTNLGDVFQFELGNVDGGDLTSVVFDSVVLSFFQQTVPVI